MRARTCSAILGAALAALAGASLAWAAQSLKGRTYAGLTSHGKAAVVLSVSSSGRQVTVTVPSLPLYCSGGGSAVKAITKPAAVHSNGSFGGTIFYRFHGRNAYKATFSGRFVSATLIRGSLRSEFASKSCSGTTAFTAKPAKGG